MAPYEALYGRPCRTSICWNEVGERKLVGPKLVQQTTENVKLIRDNLKAARDRQKSYADKRRRELEFEVGDRGISSAVPMERNSPVWEKREVKRYMPDPMHILAAQPVHLKEDLSYEEEAIKILDRKDQVLRNKTIPLVKAKVAIRFLRVDSAAACH
ncbi:uncharacterized protein LOC120079624 [Benincasa hispida]|uniref:uncharacterized protein LOC120079624 n=1 Tax=Benincasa hispida TaxID=102211 RepID=UPI00190178EE|nr:uncharacterized protein LOC120079624 [Benincasa hispida]